jgi:hypothetical protein
MQKLPTMRMHPGVLIILTISLDVFVCPSIRLGDVLAVESKPPSADAKQA